MTRSLHHLRGNRRRRQEHAPAALCAIAAGKRALRSRQAREPGGTPLAELIRDWFLHQPTDPQTEALLAFAARSDHLHALDPPGAGSGAMGHLRSLHRLDRRVPGRRPRTRRRARGGTGTVAGIRRSSPTGPTCSTSTPPRRRAGAPRRGRPIASRPKTSPSSSACARLPARVATDATRCGTGHPRIVLIDAGAHARRDLGQPSRTTCAAAVARWRSA